MIVNDTYKLAFIHIPKCAGSFIRTKLRALDERNGIYAGIGHHTDLGITFDQHIPLWLLKKYLQADYELLNKYETYAIVRDPYDRFMSSISEWVKLELHTSLKNLSAKEIRRITGMVISYLSTNAPTDSNYLLPNNYVVFQKQSSFIYVDDEQFIKHVYEVSDLSELIEDISFRINGRIELGGGNNRNASTVYRGRYTGLFVRSAKRVGGYPWQVLVPRSVDRLLMRAITTSSSTHMNELFDERIVREFVEWWYADDISLVDSVIGN